MNKVINFYVSLKASFLISRASNRSPRAAVLWSYLCGLYYGLIASLSLFIVLNICIREKTYFKQFSKGKHPYIRRWVGHVARMMAKTNAHRVLVGKPDGERH
jgi:superoxide dismutase